MNEPEIRLLDETKDADLLRMAWSWKEDAPKWFRDSVMVENETFEDFIKSAKDEILFGVFNAEYYHFKEPEPTAVIRLTAHFLDTYQIHLMAHRATDWQVLAQAGLSVKKYLEERGASFFGWIPARNRGIVRLYKFLGFVNKGVKCYRGKMRNRAILWLLMESN